jgi:hypothetical protein
MRFCEIYKLMERVATVLVDTVMVVIVPYWAVLRSCWEVLDAGVVDDRKHGNADLEYLGIVYARLSL